MKDLEQSIAIDSEPLEDNYLNNPFDIGMQYMNKNPPKPTYNEEPVTFI